MPIFEYRCQQCGQQFERLSWGGEQTPTCGCGSQKVERVWYSRVAVSTSGRASEPAFADGCCGGGDEGGCCGGGTCGTDFDA